VRKKRPHFRIAVTAFLLAHGLSAQTVQYAIDEPVVVTASRLVSFPVSDLREITVIDRDEIASMPASSVADVLRLAGGVDLRPRGDAGVQCDFGLRGCSFEQVLVLVDGIRINDPQTGHHNGDVPVPLGDVDRIEILRGPASALYGSDGFGGVIQIVTKSGRPKNGAAGVRFGSFGSLSSEARGSFRKNRWSGRFSAGRRTSKGYRDDSDYDVIEMSHRSSVEFEDMALDASLGWTGKDFGAAGFYAPYPSHENTKALLGSLGMGWQVSQALSLHTRAFARRHDDRFVLDRNRPGWYLNAHRTWVAGFETHVNLQFAGNREAVLGFETERMTLKSSNLGNRAQNRFALFGETALPLGTRAVFSTGIRLDAQSSWSAEISPSFGIAVAVTDALKWRASAGRAFRAPNFTELYYVSPTDRGDPTLKPEHGWCFESGFSIFDFEATLFRRIERDRIDWTSGEKGRPWQAVNVGRADVTGFSLNAFRRLSQRVAVRVSYEGLVRRERASGYFSKYGLYSLERLLSSSLAVKWPDGWNQGLFCVYKKREQSGAATFLDARISRGFGRFLASLEMDNLLDRCYEDVPGVPSPGRSFSAGLNWNFFGGEP
jgi:iron complex outermembrane receptor protein